jgi:hypothetical protein
LQQASQSGDADYEIPSELTGNLLGFADDNWAGGTQSFVFAFDSAMRREFGYGFTTNAIHEVGHPTGLSHPTTATMPSWANDYGPGDDFYFVWTEMRSIR